LLTMAGVHILHIEIYECTAETQKNHYTLP
jgi:hypothetical protein